jgi:hypothetical protein
MAAGERANLVYGASWPPYPYVVFYEVKDDEVVVVGVRHGARDPGSMPGGDGMKNASPRPGHICYSVAQRACQGRRDRPQKPLGRNASGELH